MIWYKESHNTDHTDYHKYEISSADIQNLSLSKTVSVRIDPSFFYTIWVGFLLAILLFVLFQAKYILDFAGTESDIDPACFAQESHHWSPLIRPSTRLLPPLPIIQVTDRTYWTANHMCLTKWIRPIPAVVTQGSK
jgi:hypothetical protein